MIKAPLLEGMLLMLMGLVSLVEGIRLNTQMRKPGFYDLLGPDYYIMLVGSALIIAGSLHLLFRRREKPITKETPVEKENGEKAGRVQVIGLAGGLVLYATLIETIGYALASFGFFLLVFKILGIRSWRTNVILSVAFTMTFHLLFGHFLGVILPRGSIGINIGGF